MFKVGSLWQDDRMGPSEIITLLVSYFLWNVRCKAEAMKYMGRGATLPFLPGGGLNQVT